MIDFKPKIIGDCHVMQVCNYDHKNFFSVKSLMSSFFWNRWPCRIFCHCYFALFFFLKGWYWLLNYLDSYFEPYLSLQVAKLSISPMSIVIDSGPIRLFLYDVLKSIGNKERAMQTLKCTLNFLLCLFSLIDYLYNISNPKSSFFC